MPEGPEVLLTVKFLKDIQKIVGISGTKWIPFVNSLRDLLPITISDVKSKGKYLYFICYFVVCLIWKKCYNPGLQLFER